MNTTDFEKLIFDIDKASTENEFSLYIDTAVKLAENLNLKGREQLFLAIRGQLIVFIIEKGILPPFTLFQLFPMFSKHLTSIAGDARIENHLTLLKKHLSSIERSSYEYFLFVALIFVLEIFNGAFEKGFNNYLAYIIKSNIFEAYKYPEAYEQFKTILNHCEIAADDMAEHLGRILEPDSFFQNDAEAQSSILLWIMTVIYTEPQYVASPAFFKLEKPLVNIMMYALASDTLAMAMQVYNVAHHILGNLFQTQEEMKRFNEHFTKVMGAYYTKIVYDLPKPQGLKGSKKKIAFVRDRFVNNSTHLVEHRLIESLMEEPEFTEKYDIYVYSCGFIEKDLDDPKIIQFYEQLRIVVKTIPQEWYAKGYYYDHVQKAMIIRNDIINEGIDVIIVTVSGFVTTDFLLGTRSAPKQIYWSHGDFEYDLEGIDLRITHIPKYRQKSAFYYQRFVVPQKRPSVSQILPGIFPAAMGVRSRFPENTIFLGSIGRLVKLDNEAYLQTVAEIMRQKTETVYLACGAGNQASIKERVYRLGLEERFFFEGHIDPTLYAYVIDVYLDTFPEPSGESLNEFMHANKGLGVVRSYEKNYLKKALELVDTYGKVSAKLVLDALSIQNPLVDALPLKKISLPKERMLTIAFFFTPVLLIQEELLLPLVSLIEKVSNIRFLLFSSTSLCEKINKTAFEKIRCNSNVELVEVDQGNIYCDQYDLVLIYQDVELSAYGYGNKGKLWFSRGMVESNKNYAEYFYVDEKTRTINFIQPLKLICKRHGVNDEIINRLIEDSIKLSPFDYYVLLLKLMAENSEVLEAFSELEKNPEAVEDGSKISHYARQFIQDVLGEKD